MRTPSGSCLLSPVAAALLLAAAPALAQVKLTNGDVLQAEIVNPDAGIGAAGEPLVELDHPILGRITVPADSIAKPEEVAEAADPGALAEAADAMGQVIDSLLFTGWSKSLAAGFNGTEGNTRTLSLYANFETGIEDEHRRWAIKADYFRKTEDGDATESNLIARADRDWLIPGAAHFYFGRATFEYDQFEGFEQRVGLYGGIGYQFIDTARHSLLGRVGVGASTSSAATRTSPPKRCWASSTPSRSPRTRASSSRTPSIRRWTPSSPSTATSPKRTTKSASPPVTACR